MLSLNERRALWVDVRDALTQAIMRGHFQPGERLVESRVARELGVSQATVREALRDLERTGLVVYTTNRGCVVRRLSRADVAEMYEMRALLEGEAAQRAVDRLGATELDELDRLVDDMIRAGQAGEMTEMIELDVRLHRAIVEAADHALLTRLWSTIQPALWTRVAVVGVLDLSPEVLAERHRAVVDGLRSGDPADARGGIVHHLLELRDRAMSKLDE